VSLREKLPELVRPVGGLGVYGPVEGRVLGTAAPEEGVKHLAAAGRAWKARRCAATLKAADAAVAAGLDCAAAHWLRAYALDKLGRKQDADEAAHRAMELFSELVPQPLLGEAAAREAERREVGPSTLAVLTAAVNAGKRPLWALVQRAETLREPAFNRYPEAVADLRRAVRLAPERGWVWAHLARALDGAGDEAGAADALDKAIALSPRSGWVHAWRGQFRVRRRRPGAAEDFETALALDPSYPFTRAWRGGFLRLSGRHAEAEKELRVAIELLPCYEYSHQELFLAIKAQGRPEAAAIAADAHEHDPKRGWCRREDPVEREAALAELAKARAAAPRDAHLKAWEAWTLLGGPDAGRAAAVLGAPAKDEPAFLLAVRGEAALRAGDAKAASRHYAAAVAKKRAVPYLGGRGLARLAAGDAKGAAADLAEAVRRYAPVAPFIKGLAGAQSVLGRHAAALASIERALRLVPRDAEGRARKAEILYRAGRRAEALLALIEAGWRAPTPLPGKGPRPDAWRLAWTGAELRGRERFDEAEAALKAAAAKDPAAPWTRAWLGECRLAAGKLEAAEPELEAAVSLAPRFALARQWRGEARLRLGKAGAALADFRAAKRLDPGLERAALGEAAALELLEAA
jgi:Flp pilus assembly protein TadD